MGMPSGMELIVIALIVLLLFGGKKIPELAKGLGNGIKNFKNAVKEDEIADKKSDKVDGKEEVAQEIKTQDTTKV